MNSRPKPCRARSPSGAIRRSFALTVSMQSSFLVPPSLRRPAQIGDPGFIAFAPPSCMRVAFVRRAFPLWKTAPARAALETPIAQMRWGAVPLPDQALTFIEGVRTMTTCGDADGRVGVSAGIYLASRSMEDAYFYDADGELLILPQQGRLIFETEMGIVDVAPGEICVIPRGVKFRTMLPDGPARGYFCENYGAPSHLAEPRRDRRQRPRQRKRLSDACRGLRGLGWSLPDDGQMGRRVLQLRSRSLAARRRRLAWELRAV